MALHDTETATESKPARPTAKKGVVMQWAAVAGVPEENRDDEALFRRMQSELLALRETAERRSTRHDALGRRWQRLALLLDDALLHAKEGVHEAHYQPS